MHVDTRTLTTSINRVGYLYMYIYIYISEETLDPNSDYALVEVVEVIFEFQAQTNTELTVSVGDQLVVTKQNEYGWWEGYHVDDPSKRGLFPANYVQAMAEKKLVKKSSIPADMPVLIGEGGGGAATSPCCCNTFPLPPFLPPIPPLSSSFLSPPHKASLSHKHEQPPCEVRTHISFSAGASLLD